jgi:hypothetical protein
VPAADRAEAVDDGGQVAKQRRVDAHGRDAGPLAHRRAVPLDRRVEQDDRLAGAHSVAAAFQRRAARSAMLAASAGPSSRVSPTSWPHRASGPN